MIRSLSFIIEDCFSCCLYSLKFSFKTIFLLGFSLLVGCVAPATKTTTDSYTRHILPKHHQHQLKYDISQVGVLYVNASGDKDTPISIYVDEHPVATHYVGYARLPLYPGNHILKVHRYGGLVEEIPFTLTEGSSVYFRDDKSKLSSSYREVSEDYFYEGDEESIEKFKNSRQFQLRVPYQNFLPKNLRAILSECLSQSTYDACKQVYSEIPLVLISIGTREKIRSNVDMPEKQRTILSNCLVRKSYNDCEYAYSQIPLILIGDNSRENIRLILEQHKEDEARQKFEATLPKDVLRDKYMLALSDALSNKQFAKAIPVFKKLQAMGMPLDPDFYYFYGEALYETGNNAEALRIVSKYIRANGNQAQFYQDSLQLLNKIQASM